MKQMANEKLFKLRLEMHWTNSHSYVGGCPDVFVMAQNVEEAKKKVYANYKEVNKRVAGVIMEEEVKEPFIF
jgi:hypothetical protein